jgi:hypothetical protein
MNKNGGSDGRVHCRYRDDGHGPQEHEANSVAWWREAAACALDPVYRMALLRRFSFLGLGLGTLGCSELVWLSSAHGDQDLGTTQQSEAEDEGEFPRPWYFPGAVETDVRGSDRWTALMPQLAARLAPAHDLLLPFYRPTLFQTLMVEQGSDLRGVITPINWPDMCRAYSRGHSLLSLFARRGLPLDAAIIIDAPGPEAVAAGAALAEWFEPVFIFDNWPHARGVVPSHLTLAATLYFAPLLVDLKSTRPVPRPPVFILDSNRLAAYIDAPGAFDNRYMVELPDAQAFERLGIRHLFYLTGRARETELDDLNGDFVTLANSGIDIRLLALDDFRRADGEQACGAEGDQPFLFGGDEETDQQFWNWYAPLSPPISGSSPIPPPPWMWPRTHYRPTGRPTFVGRPPPVPGGRTGPGSAQGAPHPPWGPFAPHYGGSGGGRSGSLGRSHASSGS